MGPPFICDQRKRKYVCICKIPWMYSNYTWEANNWKKDPKQRWIKWSLCVVLNLIFRSVLQVKVKFFQCKNSHLLKKQYGGSRNPLIVVGSKSFESVSILFNFPKWIFESVVCLHTQLAKVSPFKFVMLQVFPTFNSICLASEIASFHQFSLVFIQKKIWILLLWIPLYILGNCFSVLNPFL